MSFEYSSKIEHKINIQDFINAINNTEFISARCLYSKNDQLKIGFKFYNVPDHSWGDDAVMEINNNLVYLIINAGDLKQRENIITAIQDVLKGFGVPADLEEM